MNSIYLYFLAQIFNYQPFCISAVFIAPPDVQIAGLYEVCSNGGTLRDACFNELTEDLK